MSEQFRISKTQEIDFFISNISSSTLWTLLPGPRHHFSHPREYRSSSTLSICLDGVERQFCLSEWKGIAIVITWTSDICTLWCSRSTLAAYCRLGYGLQSTVTCWLYPVLHLNCKLKCRVLFRDGSIKEETNQERRIFHDFGVLLCCNVEVMCLAVVVSTIDINPVRSG